MKNSTAKHSSAILPLSAILMAWGLAFCASCWLTNSMPDTLQARTGISASGMMLSESRAALSAHFYEQADTYFHGGWEHQTTEAFQNGVFQRMQNEISPRFHVHLHGNDIKEIMPWMRLATLLNPSDVRIYLDTSFWLIHEAGRPDIAEQVLNEAQINNPFNYQVQLEKGRLFLIERKLRQAKSSFDASLAFWPGKDRADEHELQDGRARILLYRALIYEAEGDKTEAIWCLTEILKLFPERTAIQDRINTLKEGKEPSLLASRVWSDMLRNDADRKSDDQCKHPGE